MGVSPEELRLVAWVIGTAYAVMVVEGFAPSWRARRARRGAVRASRRVPLPIEALWVFVQVVLIGSFSLAFIAPGLFGRSPASGLGYSSLAASWVGAALFAAGAALAGLAARHLGAQLAVAIETREGGKLVTSGPYARVRHPIYTGIFLMVGGLALALASPAVALWIPIALYCAGVRARIEEEMLSADAALGASYKAYLESTGRFIPGPRAPRG